MDALKWKRYGQLVTWPLLVLLLTTGFDQPLELQQMTN